MALTAAWVLAACRLNFDEVAARAADGAVDVGVDGAADARPPGQRLALAIGQRPGADLALDIADTQLYEGGPTASYGADPDLSFYGVVGSRYFLLYHVELGSLAPPTQVTSARLRLFTFDVGDTMPGPIELYEPGEAWTEAGATWLSSDGVAPWLTAGGTRGALIARIDTLGVPGDLELPFDPAVAERWIREPTTNRGLLLYVPPGGTHAHLRATETPNAGERPQLELELVP